MKPDKSILKGFPPKKLNEAVATAIKGGIVAQSASTFGLGGKLITFVNITDKKNTWVIEIFAESFINKPPTNQKQGYTSEEIGSQSGLYISKKVGEGNIGDRYFGTFVPLDTFEKWLNGTNRVLLFRYIDALKARVNFDDEDLERFSHIYMNRTPGGGVFGSRSLN